MALDRVDESRTEGIRFWTIALAMKEFVSMALIGSTGARSPRDCRM
jgi:hypothetical protein